MLRCPHCGKENPVEYRFCGMCGKPISPPAATPSIATEVKAPVERQQRDDDVPFTGPSFLGLGHNSEHAEYLLEDEESSSGHGRMYMALVLLLIAGGLLGWRWHFGMFPWQGRMNVPAANTSIAQPNAANTSTPTQSTTQPSTAPAQSSGPAENPGQSATPPPPQQPSDLQPNQAGENVSTAPAIHPAENAPAANDNQPEKPAEPVQPDETSNAAQQAKNSAPPKKTPVVSKPPRSKQAPANEEDSSTSEAEALLVQGERYLYGNGVPQNCGRAQSSLEAAADHNSTKAFSDLGTMYSTGQCVKRDLPIAYRWFAKALHQEPANKRIATDLQVLWNQMSADEKQAAMRTQ